MWIGHARRPNEAISVHSREASVHVVYGGAHSWQGNIPLLIAGRARIS